MICSGIHLTINLSVGVCYQTPFLSIVATFIEKYLFVVEFASWLLFLV